MTRITRESCRKANACWSDKRLAEAIPTEGLTPTEVAEKEDVSLADRIWVLIRAAGLSEKEQRLFACRTAGRALLLVREPDKRSVEAINIAERYANGETSKEELRKVYAAASAV